jgi:short-subunit dehydrogenase
MRLSDLKGHWALVTGASSGIGEEFARQLAQAGMPLVLVARREERLAAVVERLRAEYEVEARAIVADLADVGTVARIHEELDGAGIRIRLLCNNAGAGRWGRFEATDARVYDELNTLNTTTLVATCRRFFDHLASFPGSAVINVSSAAAYQPVPYMAVYAASKAFVQSFSQALHGEWKEHGIVVQTLVPGPTDTEFDAKAGAYESALTERDAPADVVRASLAGLERGVPVVNAARGTYKQRVFAGLAPHAMVIREVGKMFRPPQDK